MDEQRDGWINRPKWIDGQMDGWMDGWADGRTEEMCELIVE